ncbi:hypothetical protein IL306_006144 [Fusarium sp. DS 682]|nr:hypothetical protein IL306_006144 [Fusarium sp. DS 682]
MQHGIFAVAIRYLDKPISDKKPFKLLVKLSHQNQRGFLVFEFPLYLKGDQNLSHIYLPIDTDSLSSFTYSLNPQVSGQLAQQWQGTIAKLTFQLRPNSRLNTLSSTAADKPLIPKGAKSGTVLDGLRLFTSAKEFSAYVQKTDLSESTLDTIANLTNNQQTDIPYMPDEFSTLFPDINAKPIGWFDEEASPPAYKPNI